MSLTNLNRCFFFIFLLLSCNTTDRNIHRYDDFTAVDNMGNQVSFSDYFKGEYVLLEFSSPTCSFCEMAIPQLNKLHNNEDELTIITLSVDDDKEAWLNSLETYDIKWISLWNEEGRNSKAYKLYNITGTPTYCLYNKNGRLLKRWNGFSNQLANEVHLLIH